MRDLLLAHGVKEVDFTVFAGEPLLSSSAQDTIEKQTARERCVAALIRIQNSKNPPPLRCNLVAALYGVRPRRLGDWVRSLDGT
jgi:hypothetical protein